MNRMKIMGCLGAVVISCGMVGAQPVKLGFRAGLNLPNITAGGTSTPVSEGYTSRTAMGMGLFTEYALNPKWSLRLGVEYSEQGGKKDGMQAMPVERLITNAASGLGMGATAVMPILIEAAAQLPTYYYADIKNKVRFHYVMIPMLAQFNIPFSESKWGLYINAGPFVSFLVGGSQVSKGTSKFYTDASKSSTLWEQVSPDVQAKLQAAVPDLVKTLSNEYTFGTMNITGEMKVANFGLTGNVGLRYTCGRNAFFVEAGGNYGFITVQQDSKNGSNRLGAASVMLGYSFSLE